MRRIHFILAGFALVLLSGTAYYLFFMPDPLPEDATFADEFALTLRDYEGNDVALSAFEGSVLVVYLFASWCPYCGDEMRALANLKSRYGEAVSVLAVNRAEPLLEAKAYTDSLGITGLLYLIDRDDTIYKDIGGYAMPETVFITERGEILFHQRGPIKIPELEARLAELLAE
jgi:thiol-disulfide isomerase/thioredoxin